MEPQAAIVVLAPFVGILALAALAAWLFEDRPKPPDDEAANDGTAPPRQ